MALASAATNSCQSTLDKFLDLKEAFASATIPQSLATFNIGTILAFFIETKADFKAIISDSYELFTSGYIREALNRKRESGEALEKYKERKKGRFKKLCKKTHRGQPVMKNQIEYLLDKIEKQVTQT